MDNGLSLAIKAAGSARKLARKIGVTPQAISQWEKVPLDRILEVEKATGVSRKKLRPDLFAKVA